MSTFKDDRMEKMCRPLPGSFLPSATHGVLKSLLENPSKLPLHHEAFSKEQEKEKSLEEERNAPQSAFLGPTLWDKTLPYDGDSFQLEYMDLEEFLTENGIPSSPAHLHLHHPHHPHHPAHPPAHPHPHLHDQHPASAPQHHHHHHHHHPPPIQMPPATSGPPGAAPSPSVMDLSTHAAAAAAAGPHPPPAMTSPDCMRHSPSRADLPSSRNTPSPIDPDSIQVPVGYEPDQADLVLSSVPGQEMFDPRKHKFSAEELKPQPMVKKARKVFIPEDCKDDRYWARRRKNNVAAKRSRDARRLKENQIAIRASFLEKENHALRQEVAELRKELGHTKTVITKYQARHGAP